MKDLILNEKRLPGRVILIHSDMAEIKKLNDFNPAKGWKVLETIEMHTCGEPLRVFTGGLPEIGGNTILEMRRFFMQNLDHLRKAAMFEPRGHADMYGAVITPPVTEGADFGTFFMHNEGYSTMCGHAIIALTKLALDSGMVSREGIEPVVEIDAPPGRIQAMAKMENGLVKSVSFTNVPSFMLIADEVVEVPGIGRVKFDVAFGGAFYAFVDAGELGLKLEAVDYSKLIDYGRRIKMAVMENFSIEHPFEDDLGFLYGTIFTGSPLNPANWSRNVCIFADGEVDRSPTGSGVSARAALHYAKRELGMAERVTIESIIGTTMDVEIVEEVEYGGYRAVIPRVTGSASYTGRNRLWIDPADRIGDGFILR